MSPRAFRHALAPPTLPLQRYHSPAKRVHRAADNHGAGLVPAVCVHADRVRFGADVDHADAEQCRQASCAAISCLAASKTLVPPTRLNCAVRGAVTKFVAGLWDNQVVRTVSLGVMAINALYFFYVCDHLLSPIYAFGFLSGYDEQLLSCELRAAAFANERNAYITGSSLFLFLVLRRLVDVQAKLFESRAEVKRSGGVPMGIPMAPIPAAYKPHGE